MDGLFDREVSAVGGGVGGLIPSVSIAHLVQQRDGIVERVRQANALLREADSMARALKIGGPTEVLQNMCYERQTLTECPEKVVAGIDSKAWALLLGETGLRSFMDKKARAEWDEQIREGKTPELTADSVEATFTSLYEARGDMFERGVIELFRRLSWNYKTNQPAAFGRRIIVRGMTNYGHIAWAGCNELDDLVRAFSILDGVPEPDHRGGTFTTLHRLDLAGEREWIGPYFKIRWFGNGNGHLTFLRDDLIDGLNRIIAKQWPDALPCAQQGARR
jgi:hypothetical protein